MADSMAAMDGLGSRFSSAAALMICPAWQCRWATSCSTQALHRMQLILAQAFDGGDTPARAPTVNCHTVQAPHWAPLATVLVPPVKDIPQGPQQWHLRLQIPQILAWLNR